MDLALVQCPNCVKVLQYYDYVSHQEICNNYENLTNKGARDSFLEKPYQNKGFKGAEALADADADDENEDDDEDEDYFDYNKVELCMSLIDMYNPMFNRGFTNYRYSNMDNIIDTNIYTNPPNNSVENLLTNIENLDIGLGRENIEQYGYKIAISEVIECAICLNAYDIGSEFYTMKCMHSFCKICSELWFESRSFCPLCKTNLKL
jgi:hypothetical protein